jgi:hypothetical protein
MQVLNTASTALCTPGGSERAGACRGSSSFAEVKSSLEANEVKRPLVDALEGVNFRYQAAEKKLDALSQKLPGELMPYFECQRLLTGVALETQLLSKAADGASSTMRQLQQLGAK